jgi:hypothetical protein
VEADRAGRREKPGHHLLGAFLSRVLSMRIDSATHSFYGQADACSRYDADVGFRVPAKVRESARVLSSCLLF